MDSETEDNQTRIATAKTSFVQAVSEGIDALMNHCGYSRERATNTLVRELSRGESPSTRPNDQEVRGCDDISDVPCDGMLADMLATQSLIGNSLTEVFLFSDIRLDVPMWTRNRRSHEVSYRWPSPPACDAIGW